MSARDVPTWSELQDMSHGRPEVSRVLSRHDGRAQNVEGDWVCACGAFLCPPGDDRLDLSQREHVATILKRALPPLPVDGMSKFTRTPEGACDPGAPVRDATHLLTTGEPCCSSCRRRAVVVGGVWVHEGAEVRDTDMNAAETAALGDLLSRYTRDEVPFSAVCAHVEDLIATRVTSPERPLPLHRTEAGYPNCSTCDGGGCPDCTDPA